MDNFQGRGKKWNETKRIVRDEEESNMIFEKNTIVHCKASNPALLCLFRFSFHHDVLGFCMVFHRHLRDHAQQDAVYLP